MNDHGEDHRGDLRARISDQLVRLHKEHYGIGPTESKTYYQDDLLVCLFRGGFTRVEESLRLAGRTQAVIDQRSHWQAMMRTRFVELVELETGRDVVGFMSGNQQDPDMIAEIFILGGSKDPGTDPSA